MNLANAIEGGLTGATTLTLLQEALHKIDPKAPRPVLHKGNIVKKLKKTSGKPGLKATKLYIDLAGELLTNAAYFGLSGLGKKKNAVLRGGLLGAAAGLGVAFLNKKDKEHHEENGSAIDTEDETKKKILTVALYTAGGLLAGLAIKKWNGKGKKNKKNNKKK
ncbi:MAG: hypothetical protein ICV84_10830 [Flavisolibacter sp.]|nr:hypothetical protein [Flavisolibacter sp.]